MTNRMQQKNSGNLYYSIQRQPALNGSSTNTIPAFGLVRVTGTDSATGALIVDQPNADGQDVYVVGPHPIRPSANGVNNYGVVTKAFPIFAAYDSTSGTPAIGDTWGAAAGSYLLTKGKTGFTIQANPVTSAQRVLIASSTVSAAAALQIAWFLYNGVAGVTPTTSPVTLGRFFTDGQTVSGSTTLKSASANFDANDVGISVSGSGIAPGTTVASVTDSTTAVLSQAATATAGNVTITLSGSVIQCYSGNVITFNRDTGAVQTGVGAWLWSNQPIPTPLLSYLPLYQCRYIGTDVNNVQVWGVATNWPQQFISGASGADGLGNMFANGICVNVGGALPASSSDFGSDW